MKSLISALPHHSLYPCKAVPSNIFIDITWTKLAGNIPLTPRKTPAHQSLSTWRYVFKYFFQCLIWGSQVCKCLLLWHLFNSVRISFLNSSTNMIWSKKNSKDLSKIKFIEISCMLVNAWKIMNDVFGMSIKYTYCSNISFLIRFCKTQNCRSDVKISCKGIADNRVNLWMFSKQFDIKSRKGVFNPGFNLKTNGNIYIVYMHVLDN